jgi:hypothetical protein
MRILKVVAVVSSIALVGLYVAYRSHGGGGGASERERIFYGSKVGRVRMQGATTTAAHTPPTTAPAPAEIVITTQPFLIPSSKGGAVFAPRTFGGSKSAQVFGPGDQPVLYDDNGLTPAFAAPVTPATAPATRQATTKARQPATTQSALPLAPGARFAPGAGFRLSNTVDAEFAVTADMCSPPATQPVVAR